MSYITAERLGKVLIWVWNRCIKKTAIPYEELDFHYPDWAFIITGCIFFGVVPVLVFNGNHTSLHPDTISEYPLPLHFVRPLFNIFRPGCIHYNGVLPFLQQLGIGRCVQFFLAKHVYHVAFGGKAEYRVFKSGFHCK